MAMNRVLGPEPVETSNPVVVVAVAAAAEVEAKDEDPV